MSLCFLEVKWPEHIQAKSLYQPDLVIDFRFPGRSESETDSENPLPPSGKGVQH